MTDESEKLKSELEKLKDKEAKLEADLAIRKHPELEEAIYDVMFVIGKIRKVEKTINALQPKVNLVRAEAANKHIEFYKKKVIELELDKTEAGQRLKGFYVSRINAILAGGSRKVKYDAVRNQLTEQYELLFKAYERWYTTFEENHFNLAHFLPSMAEYLDRARKCLTPE